jgi:hypothetical protein
MVCSKAKLKSSDDKAPIHSRSFWIGNASSQSICARFPLQDTSKCLSVSLNCFPCTAYDFNEKVLEHFLYNWVTCFFGDCMQLTFCNSVWKWGYNGVSLHFSKPYKRKIQFRPYLSIEQEDGWAPHTLWTFQRRVNSHNGAFGSIIITRTSIV